MDNLIEYKSEKLLSGFAIDLIYWIMSQASIAYTYLSTYNKFQQFLTPPDKTDVFSLRGKNSEMPYLIYVLDNTAYFYACAETGDETKFNQMKFGM